MHLDPLDTVLHALAGRGVGGHLSGEGGRLARALEPGRAGGLPAHDVPLGVGDRDDGVVEAGLDVGDPVRNVLLYAAAGATPALLRLRQSSLPTSSPAAS